MARREPTRVADTQPRTYNVTIQSLLMFPFRMCNPPPAVGMVRSCGVTPILRVRLEDILDRKHLPPLGLKDFEEWLLYVEHCPENLYFILWLREYTVRYRQWETTLSTRRRETPQYLGVWPSQTSSQLAMFYARAKQTFLTPANANPYELNLPAHMLAPFHTANGSSHPDPAIFNHVAIETQKLLKESLERFISASVNNVGNKRVLCGLVAGMVCLLVGALFPILYTIFLGPSRWLRLAAFPGLWLGITLLFTSFNGICLAVYVFGDLRQLRKFEMSRPVISSPQPLYSSRRRPIASTTITGTTDSVACASPKPDLSISIDIGSSASVDSSCEIQISPAYYEADPIEGPAISPISGSSSNYAMSEKFCSAFDDDVDESGDEYPGTALFIHPFVHSSEDVSDNDSTFPSPKEKPLPEELQEISEFNFDALPKRSRLSPPLNRKQETNVPTQVETRHIIVIPTAPQQNDGLSPTAVIRRIQSKCNINRWLVVSNPSKEDDEKTIRRQYKKVVSVPAFASPLTKVLSPVVKRGQWEIVARSMLISLFLTCSILGSLLAVPVISMRSYA